jgi:hypothetical protein
MLKKSYRLFMASMVMLFVVASCNQDNLITERNESTPAISSEGKIVTLKSGVEVLLKDGKYYLSDDILLSEQQLKSLEENGDLMPPNSLPLGPELKIHPVTGMPFSANDGKAVGQYPTSYNMWAMVRYVYGPSLSSVQREIMRLAIEHWEANSNVRFYNATGMPTVDPTYGFAYPYIEFVNGNNVNSSQIGRNANGGRQELKIQSAPWVYDEVVGAGIHELGHAIGMDHEHNANDRDNFINLNLNNVLPEKRYNFNRRTTNYYQIGAVDFQSVMIYDSQAFASSPNLIVMTRKSDGSTFSGNSVTSSTDRQWVNNLYIPYIARSDVYRELANIVYKPDNTVMTAQEREQFQAQLNNGNPYPPAGGRIPNDHSRYQ